MAARQALPELWEQQHGETPKQFEAFAVYRDLGPKRTARQVADRLHKGRDLMHRWQQANAWVRRAEAYDREIERERLIDAAGHRRDMHMRTARLAAALQNKIVARLQTLEPNELSPRDLIQWLDISTRVERTARDALISSQLAIVESSEERQAGVPLSDEEREVRLEQLHAAITERLGMPSSGRADLRVVLDAEDAV